MFDAFKAEIMDAIGQYGEDHVDIVIDEETGEIYGTYHSRHQSFPVTKNYPGEMASKDDLTQFCDQINIGYCF